MEAVTRGGNIIDEPVVLFKPHNQLPLPGSSKMLLVAVFCATAIFEGILAMMPQTKRKDSIAPH